MFIVRQHTKFYLLMSTASLAMVIKKRAKENARAAAMVSLCVLEDDCLNIGPGIESRGGEIFRTCPDQPWDPSSLLYNGYRVFPGGKERPGRDADPSPLSSAVVKKE